MTKLVIDQNNLKTLSSNRQSINKKPLSNLQISLTQSWAQCIAFFSLFLMLLFGISSASATVNINTLYLLPETGQHIQDIQLSPDSQWVVIQVNDADQSAIEFYGMAIDGQTDPLRLNSEAFTDKAHIVGFAADSQRIIYVANDSDQGGVVYSALLDGTISPQPLNSLVSNEPRGIDDAQISPDGQWLLYISYQMIDTLPSNRQLYAVSVDGRTPPIPLSQPTDHVGVLSFKISSDSQHVIYYTDQDTPNHHTLYQVPIDGSDTPFNLEIIPHAHAYEITPQTNWLIYTAFEDDQLNLYGLDLEQPTEPRQLNRVLDEGEQVSQGFQLSPDGQRVVYFVADYPNNHWELHSASFEGDEVAVRLNSPSIIQFEKTVAITSDSQQVVYLAYHDIRDTYQLYSVPIDGSSNSILLHELRTPVADLAITPDSQSVVYTYSPEVDNIYQLYTAPLDVVQGAMQLSLPKNPEHSTHDFLITVDSQRVIYRAGDTLYDDFRWGELYSIPVGGGEAPTALNVELVYDRDSQEDYGIGQFKVSPDAQWIVYSADHVIDEGLGLYSVAQLDVSPTAKCGGLVQEAEAASISGEFFIWNDGQASNGQYISSPSFVGNLEEFDPSEFAQADFCFDVPQTGVYLLKGNVYAPDNGANSFWINFEGDPILPWHVSITTGYDEAYVGRNLYFNLYEGPLKLSIYPREPNTELDKLTLEYVENYVNTPPIANDQEVALVKNKPVPVRLGRTDVDKNPTTFTIVTGPTHGFISGIPPDLTYTPNNDYVGEDRITFMVNDGFEDSPNVGTVFLTVEE